MKRALPSLHLGKLKITLIVPFIQNQVLVLKKGFQKKFLNKEFLLASRKILWLTYIPHTEGFEYWGINEKLWGNYISYK